jgi:hypothetical protein
MFNCWICSQICIYAYTVHTNRHDESYVYNVFAVAVIATLFINLSLNNIASARVMIDISHKLELRFCSNRRSLLTWCTRRLITVYLLNTKRIPSQSVIRCSTDHSAQVYACLEVLASCTFKSPSYIRQIACNEPKPISLGFKLVCMHVRMYMFSWEKSYI